MHKQSIVMGLALALSLGGASLAGAQGAAAGRQDRQDRQRSEQPDRGARRGGPGRGEGFLLRGITLTADQKARIAELGKKQHEQMKAEREKQGGKGGQGANGQRAEGPRRERGDTTGFGARRAEMEQRREQHIGELRSILNADQRVQLDKNVAEMKARFADGKGRKGFGGRKG